MIDLDETSSLYFELLRRAAEVDDSSIILLFLPDLRTWTKTKNFSSDKRYCSSLNNWFET